MEFEGPCWTVGDNVPTDQIVKSHMVIRSPEELAPHVLENVNPRFAREVQPGDILVAGEHFGQSSGRAIAAKALKATGVSVLLAESLARTFFRNCLEIGLPILECEGISAKVSEGDRLFVDLARGRVTNLTSGGSVEGRPLDPFLKRMLVAGGLIPMVLERGDEWAATPLSSG